MDFLRPASWEEALAAKAEHPTAVPIAGGTDVMVEINFDHRRPEYLLDLNRIGDLSEWEVGEKTVRLGASVSYTRIMENLRAELPGLALASHTVASPQIRNRGGVGGNLGTASPAGDAHPALLASGGAVEVESVRGRRMIPIDDFYVGVKRNAMEPDELIRSVHLPKADGPQQFSKVGTRNAMVIAVCAFGIALHPETRTVRTGIGSAAPTPYGPARPRSSSPRRWRRVASGSPATPFRRPSPSSSRSSPPAPATRSTMCAAAAYRRHAVGIMARRTLGWTWESYRGKERSAQCA